jgi:Ni,Fe-hydrogenase III small subunit
VIPLLRHIFRTGILTEPPPVAEGGPRREIDRLHDEILHVLGRALTIREVTGPVTKNMENALRIAYDCTPDPKLVVAVGDCGCTGGVFGESYASCGAIENVVGVDLRIPGCPPTPLALMQGILAAVRTSK